MPPPKLKGRGFEMIGLSPRQSSNLPLRSIGKMNPKEPEPTNPIVGSPHATSDLPPEPPIVICTADPPFDKETDLILQTSDRFQFHIWKCILAEASLVFRDMFALGQGQVPVLSHSSRQSGAEASDSKGAQTSLSHQSVPIVEVPEDCAALRLLLQWIYPPSHSCVVGKSGLKLGDLKLVLAAAHKYQMDGIVLEITDILINKCSQLGPLRVYAIGARYHLPDVMRAAARSVLTLPTSAANAYVKELEDISDGAYHRLCEYRRECVATLAEMAKDLTWLADGVWTFKEVSSDCTCVSDPTRTQYHFKGASNGYILSAWFIEHYQRIASLLQDRPCQAAIADEELCEQALKEGSKCSRCREAVHYHMRLFQANLKEEMSRRIAEISLKLH